MFYATVTKEQAKAAMSKSCRKQCAELFDNEHWPDEKWTFIKEITAGFTYWAIRQCYAGFCPENLEIVLKNLSFFLWEKFNGLPENKVIINNDGSIAYVSLIVIYEWLHEFVLGDDDCFKWCYLDGEATKGYIDLRSLVHNICISILEERNRD